MGLRADVIHGAVQVAAGLFEGLVEVRTSQRAGSGSRPHVAGKRSGHITRLTRRHSVLAEFLNAPTQ